MGEIATALQWWRMDEAAVRERMYRAPTPRERERWHALWLLAQGWSAARVAESLGREPHTIGEWLHTFTDEGGAALAFEQTGGVPRPRPCATDRTERGGMSFATSGGNGMGELVLEVSAAISARAFRHSAWTHRLQ